MIKKAFFYYYYYYYHVDFSAFGVASDWYSCIGLLDIMASRMILHFSKTCCIVTALVSDATGDGVHSPGMSVPV